MIAAGRDRHLRARAGRLVARGDLLRAHRRRGRAVVSHALSAELFKLRTTRTSWAVILGALGLVVLISVIAAATGSFSSTDDAGEDLLQISGLVQLFALVIGILAVATEFRHGTITPSLLAVPDRTRLVLAKLITRADRGRAARPRRLGAVRGDHAPDPLRPRRRHGQRRDDDHQPDRRQHRRLRAVRRARRRARRADPQPGRRDHRRARLPVRGRAAARGHPRLQRLRPEVVPGRRLERGRRARAGSTTRSASSRPGSCWPPTRRSSSSPGS